jgi:hypothetical protein
LPSAGTTRKTNSLGACVVIFASIHARDAFGLGYELRPLVQVGEGGIMNLSAKTWTVIHQVYDTVHNALWALGIAWVVFLLLHIPQMRDARVRAEVQRAQEISEENRSYCEKWGMRADTHEHIICTMDLNAIRAKVEQRIADDSSF